MHVYGEFPAKSWIIVKEVKLFVDGKRFNGKLDIYDKLYDERTRNCIQTLKLTEGQEKHSANELRPPLRGEKTEDGWRYKFDGYALLFKDDGRRKVTLSVEKGARIRVLSPVTITKVAEAYYEIVRRE